MEEKMRKHVEDPGGGGGGGLSVGTVLLALLLPDTNMDGGASSPRLQQIQKFKQCKSIWKYKFDFDHETSSECQNLRTYKPATLGHKCLFLRQILIGAATTGTECDQIWQTAMCPSLTQQIIQILSQIH